MDLRFLPHNRHLESPAAFVREDPHLRRLRGQPLVHRSPLLGRLPRREPGIYTLGGGRQVGKTTLLKQWMAELLDEGAVLPARLAYLTGELIDDQHALVRLVTDLLADAEGTGLFVLVIDEVTYVRGWERGVKYLADAGLLEHVVLVVTGSDLVVTEEARASLPGRRGRADVVDFHLHPLDYGETLLLRGVIDRGTLAALRAPDAAPGPALLDRLFDGLRSYLHHGGFLTALNDLARDGRILPATYATYAEWIRGDILRRGKQEPYLREVLGAIARRYGSQLTWNSLAKDLSIEHPATVADYVHLLASMDAVFVQAALVEDKLVGAPKKARRVVFSDPFIFHAVSAWLDPTADPFARAQARLEDPAEAARHVEACVVNHARRRYPTYYIKARGEVDVAWVDGGRFWPVEVKWTGQLRPKDVQQVARYPNGRIWDRGAERRTVLGVPTEPLPLGLLRLSDAG